MNLIENSFFKTPIYFDKKEEWLEKLNKISDNYIKKEKSFAEVYHSTSLIEDNNFSEFLSYINKNAFNILNNQGFDLVNHSLVTTELWVQEFSNLGGGHHSPHVHWNGHVSGFYFLKCSDKTSFPIFHDPRGGRMMNLLPEKNNTELSLASSMINIKPNPGMFIFFNSYLQHEFTVDSGIEPFRFIHFNIQAFPKQLINGNYKKVNNS
jgi:uncharacterized protein (TIGR02466 family)